MSRLQRQFAAGSTEGEAQDCSNVNAGKNLLSGRLGHQKTDKEPV